MADVTVELGNAYIGSAYSPVVEITETAEGHTVSITSADPEAQGQLVTQSYTVPDWSDEEAEREAQEAARQAAESARDTAEQARSIGEAMRRADEGYRQEQEQSRATAEQARAEAEQARQAAESARASAEGSRVRAEQGRASAEAARASAEAGRASAEQARATAETARAQAESARDAAERQRQAETAAAIGAANTATANANAATTAAQAAATAANTAAGEADAATDAAEAAAALATATAETVTDAYFPGLAAGSADGVTGGGPTDSAAWLQRACPGTDGPATVGSIRGRTLVWNQMASRRFTDVKTTNGLTFDYTTGGEVSISGTATAIINFVLIPNVSVYAGHKYLAKGYVDGSTTDVIAGYAVSLSPSRAFGGILTRIPSEGNIFTCTEATVYANLTFSALEGTELSGTLKSVPQLFDLTAMFGAGNEPTTVAEFEALFPLPYYPYDVGSLLSVQMEGIETVGFNQWDEQWENGYISDATGNNTGAQSQYLRSKNHIPVFPSTEYYFASPLGHRTTAGKLYFYDANKNYLSWVSVSFSGANPSNSLKTTPADAHYIRFWCNYSDVYQNDICINVSDPALNGTYEPHWSSMRSVPAATYFPNGMRSAGPAYDELTATQAVTRIEEVDLGNRTWNAYSSGQGYTYYADITGGSTPLKANGTNNIVCTEYEVGTSATALADGQMLGGSNNNRVYIRDDRYTTAADLKAALSGVMLYYELDTPTVTPIDPLLNLTYRAASGGTERILHTDPTAAPTLVVTYGSTADGIRDRALSAIADPDGPTATANHAAGTYLTMGGRLYRVTSAIASGERIVPGTNVTATTVMAEVLSLTQ